MIGKIYINSAISRPQNVIPVYKSIVNNIPMDKFEWLPILDAKFSDEEWEQFKEICESFENCNPIRCEKSGGIVGNIQKQTFLTIMRSAGWKGFVYFLDDDNLIYPDFYKSIHQWLVPNIDAIVFGQKMRDGKIRLQTPDASSLKVGFVDLAMFILNIDAIPHNAHFGLHDYCSDGRLIEQVVASRGINRFMTPNIINSWYNFLEE